MTRKLDSLPNTFASVFTNLSIQHPPLEVDAGGALASTSTSIVAQHPSPVTKTCVTWPASNSQKPYFTNLRLVDQSRYSTLLATIHWVKITNKKSCRQRPSDPDFQILTEETASRSGGRASMALFRAGLEVIQSSRRTRLS